jgi:hypothetical protein
MVFLVESIFLKYEDTCVLIFLIWSVSNSNCIGSTGIGSSGICVNGLGLLS